MLPVVWRAQALDELDDVVRYIAQFDARAALALYDRIEAAVLPLSKYPYMGRPGREDGTRELVAHPNYIVIYQVGAANVRTVSVLHARREYP